MKTVDSSRSASSPDDASRARGLLSFVAPRPWRWLQWLAFQVNRGAVLGLGLGVPGRVEPEFTENAIAKLRSIPQGAGNVMAGPHSGTHDAYLMYELCRVARRVPAGFFMAAEYYQDTGPLGRALLRRMGAVPVARGRHNPEAVRYMIDRLAAGKWCGLFPEGESYYSREVMPLELGALRIAVEAAMQVRDPAAVPILITPFAMVYFYTDRARTLQRLESVLGEIEQREEVLARRGCGELTDRILQAADALMEHKARSYGVAHEAWSAPDRFDRVERLQRVVIEELERRYRGAVQEGFVRRRAMKVRMQIYELLSARSDETLDMVRLREDLRKTRDIVIAAPFSARCLEKYGDLEMWVEYLRRMHVSLDLPQPDMGPQRAVIDVLPSINMHAVAAAYRELPDDEACTAFLIAHTERLRETLQSAVDAICAANPTLKMPA